MPRYFEFEIALRTIKPRIWRRFLLAENATFEHLHDAIQVAFGWLDYHLFAFYASRQTEQPLAGVQGEWDEEDTPDAGRVHLRDYFGGPQGASKCLYVYDFGDDWQHEVKLRKVVEHDDVFHRRLLAGKRAGPPEDAGGSWGYARVAAFVETGHDPEGDAESLALWLGDWKPDLFDLHAACQDFDAETAVDLPPGADPHVFEVADLITRTMEDHGWSAESIAEANAMWGDFVRAADPDPRKPAVYAAALVYCFTRSPPPAQTQAEVAAAFGVSAASIAQTWRQIHDAVAPREDRRAAPVGPTRSRAELDALLYAASPLSAGSVAEASALASAVQQLLEQATLLELAGDKATADLLRGLLLKLIAAEDGML